MKKTNTEKKQNENGKNILNEPARNAYFPGLKIKDVVEYAAKTHALLKLDEITGQVTPKDKAAAKIIRDRGLVQITDARAKEIEATLRKEKETAGENVVTVAKTNTLDQSQFFKGKTPVDLIEWLAYRSTTKDELEHLPEMESEALKLLAAYGLQVQLDARIVELTTEETTEETTELSPEAQANAIKALEYNEAQASELEHKLEFDDHASGDYAGASDNFEKEKPGVFVNDGNDPHDPENPKNVAFMNFQGDPTNPSEHDSPRSALDIQLELYESERKNLVSSAGLFINSLSSFGVFDRSDDAKMRACSAFMADFAIQEIGKYFGEPVENNVKKVEQGKLKTIQSSASEKCCPGGCLCENPERDEMLERAFFFIDDNFSHDPGDGLGITVDAETLGARLVDFAESELGRVATGVFCSSCGLRCEALERAGVKPGEKGWFCSSECVAQKSRELSGTGEPMLDRARSFYAEQYGQTAVEIMVDFAKLELGRFVVGDERFQAALKDCDVSEKSAGELEQFTARDRARNETPIDPVKYIRDGFVARRDEWRERASKLREAFVGGDIFTENYVEVMNSRIRLANEQASSFARSVEIIDELIAERREAQV